MNELISVLAGRPPPAQRAAPSRRFRVAGSGRAARTGANVWDWLLQWGFKRLGQL